MSRILLALVLAASAASAGCFGLFGAEPVEKAAIDEGVGALTNDTEAKLAERVAPVPRTFTFPGQVALPSRTLWKNWTLDASAATAYADRNNRGGNFYGGVVHKEDVAGYIPPGQPVEMRVKLFAVMGPGSSAAINVYANVPGTMLFEDPSDEDEFNWKYTAKSHTINTIGVAGEPHEVGIIVHNGRIAPGSSLSVTVRVDFEYVADVLTPYHPWAFQVPANATGITVTSVKAGGPEHVKSKFILVGPDDDLVATMEYNDIALESGSAFIPVKSGGEHVLYAYTMEGGFLSLATDVGLATREARPLPLAIERVVDKAGPAPGVVERDWGRGISDRAVVTPMTGQESIAFNVDGSFPLAIHAWIGEPGATSVSGMAQIRVVGPNGLVAMAERVLRYDDARGNLGYTNDRFNTVFDPTKLAKGAYKAEVVNDGTASLGHTLVTYVR
ncbi:MAG TPA: hypothetical protein VM889_00160 [Candidatus Thermoplasmatota archaeon]|nr:hypothetical protein [Candidatus Thermoplasmatota archaeon]